NLPQDGFSGASTTSPSPTTGRAQFEPSLAVDPTTGTLIATFYDARYDASRARFARFFGTSIDGGQTFGPETPLNITTTVTDLATGQTVDLEPIPDNFSTANPNRDTLLSFGERQSV